MVITTTLEKDRRRAQLQAIQRRRSSKPMRENNNETQIASLASSLSHSISADIIDLSSVPNDVDGDPLVSLQIIQEDYEREKESTEA